MPIVAATRENHLTGAKSEDAFSSLVPRNKLIRERVFSVGGARNEEVFEFQFVTEQLPSSVLWPMCTEILSRPRVIASGLMAISVLAGGHNSRVVLVLSFYGSGMHMDFR
jgi:hypothetical protein